MRSHSAVTIRRAELHDADEIAELYLRARKQNLAFAPTVHSDDETRDWLRGVLLVEKVVFVVEVDGQITAMMAVSACHDTGWVEQLYVHPDMTGRGYGTALLRLAKRLLPSLIHLYTFQENHGARRFYEREGFVPVRFSDGSGNEEGCPDILYAWSRRSEKKPSPTPETR